MASRSGRGSLTPRQNEIYEFIRSRIEEEQAPPTIPEIAKEFKLRSTNGVFEHLNALEVKGYIIRHKGKARGIALVDPSLISPLTSGSSAKQLPIVGDGHSSNPYSIFMNPRGMFTPDPETMPTENAFVAIVTDDGMDKEGIFKGDLIVVRQTPEVEDGMLVFALVGNSSVVRRLEQAGPRKYLTAVNRHYQKVGVVDGSPETALLGEVAAVVRKTGRINSKVKIKN
ncbi:MAG: transcriptional repressor LexA [Ignavibacteriae bacterium]|nr:transcriptional repressor LexA [Ignavibacteriota bacterium]MCB9214283.1 repressor LexA [Ignavibacteria bacterium]